MELEQKDGIAISDSLNELQTLLLPKCELIKELISAQSLTANVILSITMGAGDAPELVISKDNMHFLHILMRESDWIYILIKTALELLGEL